MPNPYFFTSLLYFLLAILGAVNAALTSYTLVPGFSGLRWMRVHLITLGILTQVIFAVLPGLVARRAAQPPPKFRWDIWALLNVGVMALLYGIPLINTTVILAGGFLVFLATVLLILQLYRIHSVQDPSATASPPQAGRKFYMAGLGYFLLGILIGTGLWLGWSGILQMQVPVEVHIHANNWGLLSLVFAGLIVDNYAKVTGRELAWPRAITPIFWMMVLGALGLVLGPWFGKIYFTMPGLILHIAATVWLVLSMVKPLWGEWGLWNPGLLHLVVSYIWLIAPVAVAPFVLLGVQGISGVGIEQNVPQALIYGWALQFGYAFIPYFYRRVFLPETPPRLGGTWLTLVLVNLGCILLWLSIFVEPAASLLHGGAYTLWALSMLPIGRELWQITKEGSSRFTSSETSGA